MKKTILITGGAGFIGSHLCEELLKENYKIINLDNFHEFYSYKIKIRNIFESLNRLDDFKKINIENYNLSKDEIIKKVSQEINNEDYKLYYGDIRDEKIVENIFSVEKPEIIINLAGLAGVRPSLLQPMEYEDVNIKGFLNLLENCKKFQIKKFIQASSSSVYGNNKKVPFSEKDIVDFPISPYAATKKSGEILGHVYSHLYGVNMIQLRFFTVYGERQRPDLAIHKFTKKIINDEEIEMFGDGSSSRDYTYVKDIVQGIKKSIDYLDKNKGVYEILNLGNSNTVSLKEMISTIEETLNKKAKVREMPKQSGDVDRTFADISKAKEMIKYNPQTTFKDGIKNFINWYKKI
ncbi:MULTISPECIES: GDP-mannose 4,6-dehydratase [Fusobacterium]|uniref:GDP-mannose 4,6-dehydratase n=1 Tax=Fusobacterium TaxID=848 RepID=UPI0014771854|nr:MULTISPECIES: GDP-mannose 4,6-dehydratase [Fusobacterium]NME35640.1 NAD-dependent epimerase/dehydratase family protein [Fusobacterium sp. FSA-380-WT-3A]